MQSHFWKFYNIQCTLVTCFIGFSIRENIILSVSFGMQKMQKSMVRTGLEMEWVSVMADRRQLQLSDL